MTHLFCINYRLLVFAQKCSNQGLANFMALSFYFEVVTGFIIMTLPIDHLNPYPMPYLVNYWLSTQHPVSRLHVFFMGICAGVLCTRIQEGDLDAFQSKIQKNSCQILMTFTISFIISSVSVTNLILDVWKKSQL